MAFDWKSVLSTVAPGIATALGGPLAGLGTKAIISALGLGPDASEAEIAAAVNGATPADLLALKKADQEFALELKKLDVSLDDIAAKDRDSARKRASEQNDWTPQIIGGALILVWSAINYCLLTGLFKPTIAPELVGRVLGMIDGATMMFLAWLYGSSRGNGKKDDTIRNLSA